MKKVKALDTIEATHILTDEAEQQEFSGRTIKKVNGVQAFKNLKKGRSYELPDSFAEKLLGLELVEEVVE